MLFVGAGFSVGALNAKARNIPTLHELAEIIWDWLEYPGSYDGTPLNELYETAKLAGKTLQSLRSMLEDHLLATQIADWYRYVPRIFWYKIYGTNVDNVIEKSFNHESQVWGLKVISAPKDDFEERDQFLRQLQYIKLNGSLPGDPRSLTFSIREYSSRSSGYDVWYDHFVRDYIYHPTLFIGSELREPLFWQAVVSRQARGNNPEERARSFLISPTISPARLPILESLNIRHVEGTAEQFLRWLGEAYNFPHREETLRVVAPEQAEILEESRPGIGEREALTHFLTVFPRVPIPERSIHEPKTYFLGVAPRWQDIGNELDAPRDAARTIMNLVDRCWAEDNNLRLLGLLGAAGSGKSTILRRAALTLHQSGRSCFFAEGYVRPDTSKMRVALGMLPDRAVLFIDNADLMGAFFPELIRSLTQHVPGPIVVFAARYNLYERFRREMPVEPPANVIDLPDLGDQEIESLISKLQEHRQLGRLEPLSHEERVHEFKIRARKQILVAMREATQGRGFDEIIRSEFSEIDDAEARVLFLCAALGTAEHTDLSKEQWLACSELTPSETLTVLHRNLKGLLIEDESTGLLAARHAVIAEFIIEIVSSRPNLMSAYQRVLSALSHDIYSGQGRRGRSWRLFVRLINHRKIFERFTEDIDMARAIYESIAEWFRSDGHFWLQYANLEIEYGNPAFARPHLAHAEALMPASDQVLTTKAHLKLREARTAETYHEALDLRREAEEILLDQINRLGSRDEYPCHVYLTQMLAWTRIWEQNAEPRRELLEMLNEVAKEACNLHKRSQPIKQIAEDILEEYLQLALL